MLNPSPAILSASLLAACALLPAAEPAFTADWASLSAGYQTPAWFRDAKFGIFLHWGPCSVPAAANDGWYGRWMYRQSGAPWGQAYKHHVATYGHPSVFGYKDLIPLWKAEHWDPAELTAFFRDCGARYLVPVAVHHDNFDVYDSTYQQWNSVRLGPKRDILAGWKRAAATAGLRFGVSSHSDRTWGWFETSRDADQTGPKAGVRYDGWLTAADGKGQWWDGLDPQALYSPPHEGHEGPAFDAFVENWRLRTMELIGKYEPDLIYFDGGLPFGQVGLDLAAAYYNGNRARHGGKLEAVLNIKGGAPLRAVTHDIERGQTDRVLPLPWQTDTSLNNHWFADRLPLVMPNAASVLHLLADVVSKNGNLLLNLGLEADGTLPEEQRAIMRGVGSWLQVNGEAIYGTRPARIFGEGPTRVAGGSFNQRTSQYTARDIRFTTRDGTLYAIVLGLPADRTVLIRSLGTRGPFVGSVTGVRLLGGAGPLACTSRPDGLAVTLPEGLAATPALVLAIGGLSQLEHDGIVRPDLDGTVDLSGFDASLHGSGLRVDDGAVAYWNSAADHVSWRLVNRQAVEVDVTARVAHPAGGSVLAVEVAGQRLVATMPETGGWNRYRTVHLGTLSLPAGTGPDHLLELKAVPQEQWKALNLSNLRLIPRPPGSPAGWVKLCQTADGSVLLPAADAAITGTTLKLEGDGSNLGFWSKPGERAAWTLRLLRPGTFRVELEFALETDGAGSVLTLAIGERRLNVKPDVTGGWGSYMTRAVGTVDLPAGDHQLSLSADTVVTGAINLRSVALMPIEAPDPALPMGSTQTGPAAPLPVCR